MKSPNYFIVKPKENKRYKNTEKFGDFDFLMTNSLEKADHTNREAEVLILPENYEGNIEVGDILIVHHNTFRIMRTQRNTVLNSRAYVMDGMYAITDYYLHIDKKGDKFTKSPYIFMQPIIEEDLERGLGENENIAKVIINNDYIEKLGIKKGNTYAIKDFRNYVFRIDKQDYYRVTADSVLAEV